MSPSVRRLMAGLIGVAGCSSFPDVVQVEALEGSDVVSKLDPQEVEETAFEEDLPPTLSFDVEFDETMKLTSARDHLWIEDQEGTQLEVDLSARLQVVTVVPTEELAPGENHTLVVEDDIQDNSGNEMLHGYRIAFFTAEP